MGVALETGLEPADAGAVMKLIDGFPTTLMASMAHDLLAGKPIELDGLSGAVARLGKQLRRADADAHLHRPGAGALHQRQAVDVMPM